MKVTIGESGSKILVDSQTSEYIVNLQLASENAGWKFGTSLVDLTGANPGASFILGAVAPGAPWLLGCYSGSEKFVTTALGYVDKAILEKARILSSPAGSLRIPETALEEFGLVFPEEYSLVGEFHGPKDRVMQLLYKPLAVNLHVQ